MVRIPRSLSSRERQKSPSNLHAFLPRHVFTNSGDILPSTQASRIFGKVEHDGVQDQGAAGAVARRKTAVSGGANLAGFTRKITQWIRGLIGRDLEGRGILPNNLFVDRHCYGPVIRAASPCGGQKTSFIGPVAPVGFHRRSLISRDLKIRSH